MKIHVWPDGSWCWNDELHTFGIDKSDDYDTFAVPEWATETDCEMLAGIIQKEGRIDSLLARSWKPIR